MLDTLIVGAQCLLNGRFQLVNVGLRGKKIVFIGKEQKPARQKVNAWDDYLVPGFIDVHSHSDLDALRGKKAVAKISQGFTCEVVGNCGLGVFPVKPGRVTAEYFSGLQGIFGSYPVAWRSFSGYCRHARGRLPVHLRMLSSYATLRRFIAGDVARPLSRQEQGMLLDQLRHEFAQGTGGLSFGMIYPPNCFADDKEIKKVLRTVAATRRRLVTCHLWDEGDRVEESLARFLQLTRGLDLKVEISHLKAYGNKNRSKMQSLLKKITRAQGKQEIAFDIYPYLAGSTVATALLPPWSLAGGNEKLLQNLSSPSFVEKIKHSFRKTPNAWENYYRLVGSENIRFINLRYFRQFNGWTLAAIAQTLQIDEITTICELIRREQARPALLLFAMTTANLLRGYRHPAAQVGSDGLFGEAMHPRTYGTAAAFVDLVWRNRKIMSLSAAFEKLTKGYSFFNIERRGKIQKGYYADLVLLDLPQYRPAATYPEPRQLTSGVKKVWVNGRVAFSAGKVKELPGQVLRN